MGNVVDSALQVGGAIELVDQFVDAFLTIKTDKETVCYGISTPEVIRQESGTKVVLIAFQTTWDPPVAMVFEAVRKYRHLGLDFHLWWHDDDGGLGPHPLFGGDLVVDPLRFGECYTRHLSRSWFSEGQGEVAFLALDRTTGEYVDCNDGWFRQRCDSDSALERMTEAELRAVVQEAYPDRNILTVKFAKDKEVLGHDGVVNCVQKLNDLILQTWGPQWFAGRGKTFGEVTEEEMGESYDQLIAEAYPEEAARIRELAEIQARREQNPDPTRIASTPVLDGGDDDVDYFAKLAGPANEQTGGNDPDSEPLGDGKGADRA